MDLTFLRKALGLKPEPIEIVIGTPSFNHLTDDKIPLDFKHQLHKWTAGILGLDHQEPEGSDYKTLIDQHKATGHYLGSIKI